MCACLFFLLLTNCGSVGITPEILKSECLRSIEGALAETTYTYDYVKNSEDWYFLSDEEKKELFNKAKIADCQNGDVPAEKKYQIGLRKMGEHSFEVKAQLKSN